MSIATTIVPRVARIELIPVKSGPFQYPRQIDNDLTLIGSGESCDICLASAKVDPAHAALVRIGPAVFLSDLGSPSGTSINDRKIRCERVVQGSIISIGDCDFRVQIIGDGPLQGPIPAFALRREEIGAVIRSQDGVVLIGSDAACDLVLRDANISPRHVLVAWTTHGPAVRDLIGAYNVRRNGRKIRASLLNHGDKIGVGPFELIFETAAQRGAVDSQAARRSGELKSEKFISTVRQKAVTGTDPTARRRQDEAPAQHAHVETPEKTSREKVSPQRASAGEFTAAAASNKHTTAPAEESTSVWDGLRREREQLSRYQGELHNRLRQQAEAEAASEPLGFADEPTEIPEPTQGFNEGIFEEKPGAVERVFGGEFQPAGAASLNTDETGKAAGQEDWPSDVEIQEQASRLAEMVRRERREMEQAEGRFETMRFEIERLRSTLSRTGDRHRSRQNELNVKSKMLHRSREALEAEREAVEVRLRQIEANQSVLQIHIKEVEEERAQVEAEEREICEARKQLETRRTELRSSLEAERQRLRLRHAELQAKASELARIARERRERIEARVSREQAALEAHEKQIRAQRAAIEEASRSELDRTASELEQVLSARLSDIEIEITNRQTDLNHWMETLAASDSEISDEGAEVAEAEARKNELISKELEQEGGRMEMLQQEIGELQNAIREVTGEQGGKRVAPGISEGSRNKRWSGTMKTRLNEKIASLRGNSMAPSEKNLEPIPLVGEESEPAKGPDPA